MKFTRTLAVAFLSTLLVSAPVAAAPEAAKQPNSNTVQQKDDILKMERPHCRHKGSGIYKHKDPLKRLQEKREKIQSLLKEGKITKEKADSITSRIDSKIKKIEEFNKLSPEQKKEKLMNDFKERLEKKVKDGRLTRGKADSMLKEFTEKVQKWDGNGYPGFLGKGLKNEYKDRQQ